MKAKLSRGGRSVGGGSKTYARCVGEGVYRREGYRRGGGVDGLM